MSNWRHFWWKIMDSTWIRIPYAKRLLNFLPWNWSGPINDCICFCWIHTRSWSANQKSQEESFGTIEDTLVYFDAYMVIHQQMEYLRDLPVGFLEWSLGSYQYVVDIYYYNHPLVLVDMNVCFNHQLQSQLTWQNSIDFALGVSRCIKKSKQHNEVFV